MRKLTKKNLLQTITSCFILANTASVLGETNPTTASQTPVVTEGAKLIGVTENNNTVITPTQEKALTVATEQPTIQASINTPATVTTPTAPATVATPTTVATPAVNNSNISPSTPVVNAAPVSNNTTTTVVQNTVPFDFEKAKTELASNSINIIFANKLNEIYVQHPTAIWSNASQRNAFEQQLTIMALSGIHPQYQNWIEAMTNEQLSESAKELVLSDAMIGYSYFTQNVAKLGDKWLYKSNSYKVASDNNPDLTPWISAVTSGQLSQYIDSLKPQTPQFDKMLGELQARLKAPKTNWPTIAFSAKSLKPNAALNQAEDLEFILRYFGYLDLPPFIKEDNTKQENVATTATADNTILDNTPGIYNARLANGVKYFQQSLGLEPDGIIGTRTKEWLNISPEQRIALLALNMQRLRLIPGTVDTGIMVNIPDYSLRFYKTGDIILESKVIVGSPARKTPIMSNSINRVVINPPWSVPTKLAREDIAPKGIKDPEYFVKHGYSLVELSNGQPISVDDILWENVSANNFPFAIRQSPGAGNSLGRYKFDMPNDQAIYLHDTPNHGLFNKDIRAISSGCIRVNKSTELANLLLNVENWDSDKIAGTVKKGATTPVNLGSRVPVELYYLTAWVDDNGKPQFRTDIYQYDKLAKNGIDVIPVASKIL